MTYRYLHYFVLPLVLLLLAACGGGGGGGSQAAQPVAATLTLSTVGALPPGDALAGVGITIVLPTGITVKTASGGVVADGVVTVSGGAAPGTITPPLYIPAAGTTPAKLSFIMATSTTSGFVSGTFATIACDIAAGATPHESDFSSSDFKPVNLKGAPVSGLTASITAEFR